MEGLRDNQRRLKALLKDLRALLNPLCSPLDLKADDEQLEQHARRLVEALPILGPPHGKLQLFAATALCPILHQLCACVTLLNTFDEAKQAEHIALHGKVSEDPPFSLLSLLELRLIYSTLEIVWRWGAARTLTYLGVKVFPSRPVKTILIPDTFLRTTESFSRSVDDEQRERGMLTKCLCTLSRVICMKQFMPLMLDRFLGNLVLGLMFVSSHVPTSEDARVADEELQYLKKTINSFSLIAALRNILISARVNPRVINAQCQSLMTDILLQDGGLYSILHVYLDGITGFEEEDIRGHVLLAKAIATIPSDMTVQTYYQNLGRQIKDLLKTTTQAEGFKERLLAMIVTRMLHVHRDDGVTCVIVPCIEPFLGREAEVSLTPLETGVRTEAQIDSMLRIGSSLLLSAPPLTPLVIAFEHSGTIRCILEVYFWAISSKSSVLRMVTDILTCYILRSPTAAQHLAFCTIQFPKTIRIHAGGSGGATVASVSGNSMNDSDTNNDDTTFPEIWGTFANMAGDLSRKVNIVTRRVQSLTTLLQHDSLSESAVSGELFEVLINWYMSIKTGTEQQESVVPCDIDRTLTGVAVVGVASELGPAVLKTGLQIIRVIRHFLDSEVSKTCREDNKLGSSSEDLHEDEDLVVSILGLLTLILELGNSRRPESEENELRALMPSLRALYSHPTAEVSEMSHSALVSIMTRDLVLEERKGCAANEKSVEQTPDEQLFSAIEQAQADLQSSQPPLRAHGVHEINRAVNRLGKVASAATLAKLEAVLLGMLVDSESYVYLGAVHGLAKLTCALPSTFVPRLCNWFVNGHSDIPQRSQMANSPVPFSFGTRSKIGEALLFAMKKAGETLASYAGVIIQSLLRGCRERVMDSKIQAEASESRATDPEFMDAVFFRTGCVTLVAEVIALIGWGARPHMRDVMDMALGIATLERSNSKEHVHARRAAASLLFICSEGLGSKIFSLAQDQLLQFYRTVKRLTSDCDAVVAFHGQRAFAQLDKLVREEVFLHPEHPLSQLAPIRILR